MSRIFTLVTVLALAATMEIGAVVVANAQGASSAMDKCMAKCRQDNRKRCESYCDRRRATH
jgi:hypothetical protein